MNSPVPRFRQVPFRAILCVLALVACGRKERPGTPPKHLLVVSVENLRADRVTHLGYERRTTALLRPKQPVVLDFDRLGLTGVSFSHAFAPSSDPETSLTSLLAAELPKARGAGGPAAAFDPGHMGVAESFHRAGFVTAGFFNARSIQPANQTPGGLGRGFSHIEFHATDEETLAAAVAWLGNEYVKGAQHMSWIHLAGIQAPFTGEPFKDRHSLGATTDAASSNNAEFIAQLELAGTSPNGADRRRLNDMYDGRLARTTELMNSFFFLYKNNFGVERLWEDSVVAMVGVTGCELAESTGRVAGRNRLSEEALRVPIMFAHVGSLTGERIFGETVELADFGATFMDWFRVAETGPHGGRSLLAIMDSYVPREFEQHPALSFEISGDGFSLRSERFRWVHRQGQDQLFDLQSGLAPGFDVADEFSQVLSELKQAEEPRLQRLGLVP